MANAIRVTISGRVQGVGFRAWTITNANRLGLKGWVCNRGDGSVEAVFSGEDAPVAAMLEACKEGPPVARVDVIQHFSWDDAVDDGPFRAMPTV